MPPNFASSHGPWSATITTIDNTRSPAYGIGLGDQINLLDLFPFERGDRVTIEIFHNGIIHQITGRASRRRTAYFAKTDLAAIGLGLHEPMWVAILQVNGQPPRVRRTMEEATPAAFPGDKMPGEPVEPEWKSYTDTVECAITPEELLDDTPVEAQKTGTENEEGAHQ